MTTHPCPWCETDGEIRPDDTDHSIGFACAACGIRVELVPDREDRAPALATAA